MGPGVLTSLWLQVQHSITLHWRHNGHGGVSNHQLHGCLLNRLFRRRSKKISKLRVTGLCAGNSPGPVNSPHKGPVTRKMVPFDDVIMYAGISRGPMMTTTLVIFFSLLQVDCPHKWPVTLVQMFDVFFIVIPNKLLKNQLSCLCYQMPSCGVTVSDYHRWPRDLYY